MKKAHIAAVVVFGTASFCFGWGPEGHKIVARIAEGRLTPQARMGVSELLGDESMMDVARWPDEVRKQPKYAWTNFHGVTLSAGADRFVYTRDCRKSCVVKLLSRCTERLKNPETSREDRIVALKCIVHFVGDSHQPVHAERAGDKKSPQVDFFGRDARLHAVWDGLILLRAGKPWERYAEELSKIKTAQAAKWAATVDPSEWVNESWQCTVKYVRDLPADNKITPAYCKRALPVLEQRLQMAGVRLAATLNAIFADEKMVKATSAPAQ